MKNFLDLDKTLICRSDIKFIEIDIDKLSITVFTDYDYFCFRYKTEKELNNEVDYITTTSMYGYSCDLYRLSSKYLINLTKLTAIEFSKEPINSKEVWVAYITWNVDKKEDDFNDKYVLDEGLEDEYLEEIIEEILDRS